MKMKPTDVNQKLQQREKNTELPLLALIYYLWFLFMAPIKGTFTLVNVKSKTGFYKVMLIIKIFKYINNKINFHLFSTQYLVDAVCEFEARSP